MSGKESNVKVIIRVIFIEVILLVRMVEYFSRFLGVAQNLFFPEKRRCFSVLVFRTDEIDGS
jgi:hypothetical protein